MCPLAALTTLVTVVTDAAARHCHERPRRAVWAECAVCERGEPVVRRICLRCALRCVLLMRLAISLQNQFNCLQRRVWLSSQQSGTAPLCEWLALRAVRPANPSALARPTYSARQRVSPFVTARVTLCACAPYRFSARRQPHPAGPRRGRAARRNHNAQRTRRAHISPAMIYELLSPGRNGHTRDLSRAAPPV